ncbi:MAG TPA: YceI family protein [Gemmatimonadales bacterium]|nr:YceI family protein [Gemmatimonadales bacterium]
MNAGRLPALASIVVLSLVVSVPAISAQRVISSGNVVRGTLSFDAKATLGAFTGTTSTVTGSMTGGSDVRDVRGHVEAQVNTLKTGNGLRDKDMMKAMEADSFPVMRFELRGVSEQHQEADSSVVTLSGQMTLHGVTRDVAIPAIVRFGKDGVQLTSTFPLNVRDYGVTRLSRILGAFKMNPDIVVHVDVVFGPGEGTSPGAAPAATPPPSG